MQSLAHKVCENKRVAPALDDCQQFFGLPCAALVVMVIIILTVIAHACICKYTKANTQTYIKMRHTNTEVVNTKYHHSYNHYSVREILNYAIFVYTVYAYSQNFRFLCICICFA